MLFRSEAPVRVWTDKDGNRISGAATAVGDETVEIWIASRKKTVTVAIEKLSERDQEWLAAAQAVSLVTLPAEDDGLIRLPLRVYIIRDVVMTQRDVEMDSWVSVDDVRNTLIPEVNRILAPAGIEWALERVIEQPVIRTPRYEVDLAHVIRSQRDAQGRSDPTRIPVLAGLCDWEARPRDLNCLYLLPYLGQASQGNANRPGTRAIVGMWTDKPSRGEGPPERFQLTEEGPFRIGSMARTCAHELGHNLGLVHPDEATQKVVSRLMGGRSPQGNVITPEEIKLARTHARERANFIRTWWGRVERR